MGALKNNLFSKCAEDKISLETPGVESRDISPRIVTYERFINLFNGKKALIHFLFYLNKLNCCYN